MIRKGLVIEMYDAQEQNTAEILLFDGVRSAETGSEYTLPDYLPDIRKILRVTGIPKITGKYLNGEKAEFEGTVQTDVLYMAEEGTIHAFSLTTAFEQNVPITGLDESCVISVDIQPENTVCRLTGPRKLSLRQKLRCAVHAFSQRSAEPQIQDKSIQGFGSSLCLKRGSVESCSMSCAEADDLRYSEDIAAGGETVTEIISCEISPVITDIRAAEHSVTCKGDYIIRILCACVPTENNRPCFRVLTQKCPFSETLEADTADSDSICMPDLSVTGVSTVLADEGKICSVDFSSELSVIVCSPQIFSPVEDAFSVFCDTGYQTAEIPVFRPEKTFSDTVSVSGTMRYDTGDTLSSVFDCSGTVSFGEAAVNNGRLTLEGSAELTAIAEAEDGHFFPLTASVPVRLETDWKNTQDNEMGRLFSSVCGKITSCKCRIDNNSHTVSAEADIAVSGFFGVVKNCQIITEISAAEENKDKKPSDCPVILYYPVEGESVWEIAKHYRIPPENLCSANHFSAEKKSIGHDDRVLYITENHSF